MGQIVGSVNPTRPQSSPIGRLTSSGQPLTLAEASAIGDEFAGAWAKGAEACTDAAPELRRAPFKDAIYNAQRKGRNVPLNEIARANALFADRAPRTFIRSLLNPCAAIIRSALHVDMGDCPVTTWDQGEKVQGATDDAERRFHFNPNDPVALRRVIEQKEQELAAVQKSLNTYRRIERDRANGVLTLVRPLFTVVQGGRAS